FVIAEPCIDVMDQACIRACPVACIHFDAGKDRKLYIDPDECIDCGACVPVCPVKAIYADYELPVPWRAYADIDALWFRDKEAARARAAGLKGGGWVLLTPGGRGHEGRWHQGGVRRRPVCSGGPAPLGAQTCWAAA